MAAKRFIAAPEALFLLGVLVAGCGGPPSTGELAEGCGRGFHDSGLRKTTVDASVDLAPPRDVARRFGEAQGSVRPDNVDEVLKVVNSLRVSSNQESLEDLRRDAEAADQPRTVVRRDEIMRADASEVVVRLVAEQSERARPGPGGRYYSASRWTVTLVKQQDDWKVAEHSAQTVGPC